MFWRNSSGAPTWFYLFRGGGSSKSSRISHPKPIFSATLGPKDNLWRVQEPQKFWRKNFNLWLVPNRFPTLLLMNARHFLCGKMIGIQAAHECSTTDKKKALRPEKLQIHSPSLTCNLKMMVSKFGISYSRVPFSGSMLNFGRVIQGIR